MSVSHGYLIRHDHKSADKYMRRSRSRADSEIIVVCRGSVEFAWIPQARDWHEDARLSIFVLLWFAMLNCISASTQRCALASDGSLMIVGSDPIPVMRLTGSVRRKNRRSSGRLSGHASAGRTAHQTTCQIEACVLWSGSQQNSEAVAATR